MNTTGRHVADRSSRRRRLQAMPNAGEVHRARKSEDGAVYCVARLPRAGYKVEVLAQECLSPQIVHVARDGLEARHHANALLVRHSATF